MEMVVKVKEEVNFKVMDHVIENNTTKTNTNR